MEKIVLGNTFDFATAVKHLQDGKKVSPVCDKNGSRYFYLEFDELSMSVVIMCHVDGSDFPHCPSGFGSSCFNTKWILVS